MPHEILMPALSAGMEEGTIARWLKAAGDPISKGDVIAEIETDKATMEFEADVEGVIGSLVAVEGQVVPINTVIALLLREGEMADAPQPKQGPIVALEALNTAGETNERAPVVRSGLAATTERERVPPSSPLARRIAADEGVSLQNVAGSGPGGRIVRIDVERLAADKSPVAVGQPVAETPAPHAPPPPGASPKQAIDAPHTVLPHSGIRRVIARRLTEAKSTIPHFYLDAECEIDALLELRERLNQASEGKYRLSLNDFIIKAAALALREVPEANATWTDDAILMFHDVDVSVAVATDGGLVTPIVRRADGKGLASISCEVRELAARAREGRLQPGEFQGGGFTISNLGMHGVRSFSAIINPPQSCILAVGAAERRAVVRGDACVPATMMSCTLSVDHRSVDGAVGARYLAAFKSLVEQPFLLML